MVIAILLFSSLSKPAPALSHAPRYFQTSTSFNYNDLHFMGCLCDSFCFAVEGARIIRRPFKMISSIKPVAVSAP